MRTIAHLGCVPRERPARSGELFAGGAIRGGVREAQARRTEMLVRYERTIQSAFRDVEDALADRYYLEQHLAIQARQVDALQDYGRLWEHRYNNGYSVYLEVVDAERTLCAAELSGTNRSSNCCRHP
jgi:multidrug efflux system outer membrane protein